MGRRLTGLKIDITIRSEDFKVLQVFKTNSDNLPKVLKAINFKYGIKIREPKKNKDLEWLK